MLKRTAARQKWQRRVRAVVLVCCLALSVLPTICAAADGKAADRQTIGLILPLTGRYAELGNRALDAALLAAGLFDETKVTPVRFLIEDSRGDPTVAGAAVEKLAAAGAVCILGPLGSQEALEAAKTAQRLKIPILTLTQKEGITGVGEYVFRNFLTATMQIRTLVEYARTTLGQRRFAILYPDDLYGREMARLFKDEVRRLGGAIRRERSYKTDQTDFAEEVAALGGRAPVRSGAEGAGGGSPKRTVDFDALFIPDAALRVALIAPQLVYYDLTGIRLLGTSGWDAPELLKTDPAHLQGAVFVSGFFANSFRPQVNRFTEAFYMAYGREPDVLEALVYDAAGMAVRLLTENRGGTREELGKGFLQVKGYPGVTGKTSFPASRDAEKELFVLTVKDGQIMQVK
ncbi:MAG: penicillin-binding protein activator [Deltaproteobacteria bacterium]|nr:penicillin-binding protein activator [Deltaproteobacteria bacterium]